jgi:hypothetical protein
LKNYCFKLSKYTNCLVLISWFHKYCVAKDIFTSV